jgi:hypothetical protein
MIVSALLRKCDLAGQNNVRDARMEYLIWDRLSWLRFLGFDLGAPTPDVNTIRPVRSTRCSLISIGSSRNAAIWRWAPNFPQISGLMEVPSFCNARVDKYSQQE